MSQKPQNLYSKYVDYEQEEELPISNIADDKVIQKITAKNFEMEKRKFGDVLTDQTFNIPEYQRVFSWEEKHLEQFWLDIEQFIDADLVAGKEDVSDVFFSSMYFAVNDDSQGYEIIDGQQRLTTTHILLRVLMEYLEDIDPGMIEHDTITQFRKHGIRRIEDMLYRHQSYTGPDPRLTLNKHDAEFFEALIMGPEAQVSYLVNDADYDIHGNNSDAMQVSECLKRVGIGEDNLDELDSEDLHRSNFFKLYKSHRRLLNAYQFFHDKISNVVNDAESPDDAVRALLNISNFVQHSYHVGEYVIREAESDFRMQIFEILNDRGVDLTKIDRIRAAVVNAFFDTEFKQEYVDKWEDIVVAFATDDQAIDEYLSIYLSIVDQTINQIGDASAELTNAFDTRSIDSEVRPRLRDIEEAQEFIDFAHDLIGYYQDITNPDLEAGDLKLANEKQRCQEILVRLNKQQMDQWRPFVLYLYYHTDEQSVGEATQFYEVLDTIEKLNFRRLLVGEDPNIFQEVFIDTVHDILQPLVEDDGEVDIYKPSIEFLIAEMQSMTPTLFGDRFIDTITRAQSWNSQTAKLLFGKMGNEQFSEEGSVEHRLKMERIHLEHVFPRSLVHDISNPIWLREFFQLDNSDVQIASEVQQFIELERMEESDLDEEAKQRRDGIEDFIKQRFVNDIGNFVLLRDSDNISASNRPLADKILEYFNEEDGFDMIYPNRYFTPEDGRVNREYLEQLQRQHTELVDKERERIDSELVDFFNSFWTFESLKDRRVDVLLDILETLELEELSDEFGLETEPERVESKIRQQTEEEFENRLSMRMV